MNARSRFSQSAIPNEYTARGPTKKTVVRENKLQIKVFLAHSAQLAVQYNRSMPEGLILS